MSDVKKQYNVDLLTKDTEEALFLYHIAQLEHFAKTKETKAKELTSTITNSISIAQGVTFIGIFEEHSRICSLSSMIGRTLTTVSVGSRFFRSSGWPPPTQVSHCKYALLLHVSVTAF